MNNSMHENDGGCQAVEELIAWYPTGTLAEDERRRVEMHTDECASCADLLRFTGDLKGVLLESFSPHTEAELLVSFVEDRESLGAEQRVAIEGHLTTCADCREQADVLETVGRSVGQDEFVESRVPRTPEAIVGAETQRRGFWESLWGGLLKPVPAAVYLVVALLAVGLHLLRPVERAGDVSQQPSGVVILPDETNRVRQLGGEENDGTPIDASQPQYLLLELTGLESPPLAGDVYIVEFRSVDSAGPVLTASIKGAAFRDNYTIGYSLGAGVLEPGRYVVAVIDPDDQPVFRTSLVVR
jgi:hypothetical protein